MEITQGMPPPPKYVTADKEKERTKTGMPETPPAPKSHKADILGGQRRTQLR